MEHQALYRKYRPQRFGDVVGQDHVTVTLAREVEAATVAHAYLFAGPRGTGKTTTARIIAKALNCIDRQPEGEPCNRCPSCVSITEGTSLDVIELDAASHNKVEDVREIRANIGTVASVGTSRRVYILDEAHMLSRAAANALLKTLEEPPEHAHFVLATTEPYKLPDTIRSRAQRFDFHPIGSEALIGHLGVISGLEGYIASGDGLALIARHARGSVRDALGLLEQVAALGVGTVDARGVTRALGLAAAEVFSELAAAVADRDAPAALNLVTRIAAEGADLRRFVADAIEFFRGVFLVQYAQNIAEIVDEPSEVIDDWRAAARRLEAPDVFRAIDQLGDALVALREGREERLVVELSLLRLARPETATDAASLAARLDRLEERVRWLHDAVRTEDGDGRPAGARRPPEPAPVAPSRPAVEQAGLPAAAPAGPASEPTEEAPSAEALFAAPVPASEEAGGGAEEPGSAGTAEEPAGDAEIDLAMVDEKWPAIVARVREHAGARRHALFQEAVPVAIEAGALVLEIPENLPFHLDQLQSDARLEEVVAGAIGDVLGARLGVTYRGGGGPAHEPAAARPPERVPDKDELLEAADGGDDPLSIMKEILGAEPTEG